MTPFPFSAHLGYLYPDLPMEARLSAARGAGFAAVEHPEQFDLPALRLRGLLGENNLRLCQISSGTGGRGRKGPA